MAVVRDRGSIAVLASWPLGGAFVRNEFVVQKDFYFKVCLTSCSSA